MTGELAGEDPKNRVWAFDGRFWADEGELSGIEVMECQVCRPLEEK